MAAYCGVQSFCESPCSLWQINPKSILWDHGSSSHKEGLVWKMGVKPLLARRAPFSLEWALEIDPPESETQLPPHFLCNIIKRPDLAATARVEPEKAMAPHSSPLAWKIPWTEEPGGLQSLGSLRVGHDWATSLSLFTSMRWRRKWQPTPVFLPGESQGRRSLVGCRLWGLTELATTEAT